MRPKASQMRKTKMDLEKEIHNYLASLNQFNHIDDYQRLPSIILNNKNLQEKIEKVCEKYNTPFGAASNLFAGFPCNLFGGFTSNLFSAFGENILQKFANKKLPENLYNEIKLILDEHINIYNSIIRTSIPCVPDFYKKAVSLNGLLLQFVPENLKTEEIIRLALEENPNALQFVENQTEMVCLFAVSSWRYSTNEALKYCKIRNFKIIDAAIEHNPDNIKYLMEDEQTEEFCIKAVKEDPDNLKFVKNQTQAICDAVFETDVQYRITDVFELIKPEFQTRDMCITAYKIAHNKQEIISMFTEANKAHFINLQI